MWCEHNDKNMLRKVNTTEHQTGTEHSLQAMEVSFGLIFTELGDC